MAAVPGFVPRPAGSQAGSPGRGQPSCSVVSQGQASAVATLVAVSARGCVASRGWGCVGLGFGGALALLWGLRGEERTTACG